MNKGAGSDRRRGSGDRGDTMLMAAIFMVFLMASSWALISASQAWNARRDTAAVASSAARAAAQGDGRTGATVDAAAATARAESVIAAAGMTGTVNVSGQLVLIEVVDVVDYAFPAPGFASTMAATATAALIEGVTE